MCCQGVDVLNETPYLIRYLIRYLITGPSYFIRPINLEIVTEGLLASTGWPEVGARDERAWPMELKERRP
jgi:hypothetical protein